MSRRYVNEFVHQDSVDQIFMASNKQLRPNRNGNLYLQVELSDRGGTISARLWNASEEIYRGFEEGDYVRVEGVAQMYQGAMQVIASHVSRALSSEIDPDDFLPRVNVDIDRLTARLRELLRGLTDPHLRAIAECFLIDEEFMQKFSRSPAGVKNHHAYLGGLMEHVVNLMET